MKDFLTTTISFAICISFLFYFMYVVKEQMDEATTMGIFSIVLYLARLDIKIKDLKNK